jgi:hypothetical protein
MDRMRVHDVSLRKRVNAPRGALFERGVHVNHRQADRKANVQARCGDRRGGSNVRHYDIPTPRRKRLMIDGGITSWPALEGAWQ